MRSPLRSPLRSQRSLPAALTVAGLVLGGGALAACGSSTATSGHGAAGSSSASRPSTTSPSATSSSATSSSAGHTSASSTPVTTGSSSAGAAATALFGRMHDSMLAVRSLHLTLNTKAAGVSIVGAGDEAVSQGKLTALDLTETVTTAGKLRIIIVGGKTYFKLPPSLNKSGKPYALVSPNSSNPVIRQLASRLSTLLSSSSVNSYGDLAKAATTVRDRGATSVDGVAAHHYFVVVDVMKIPSSFPNVDQVRASGLTTLPMDMWVDAKGRLVKVVQNFTVSSQHVTNTITASKYDVPVHITAPPAHQVSTK